MSNYAKSLLALALAMGAMLGAGLWLWNRTLALEEFQSQRNRCREQVMQARVYEKNAAQLEARIHKLQSEIQPLSAKLVSRDYETAQVVMAVMKSAGAAGLELINAVRPEGSVSVASLGQQRVEAVMHEIHLKGPYAGFVKFLQSMQNKEIALTIKSLEIVPVSDKGEIMIVLHLALLILDEAPEPSQTASR